MSAAISPAIALRALRIGPPFWLAMFMASAFGANLGDFAARFAAKGASFAVMAAICAAAIWADRRQGLRTEAWYWIAIIALRAAATNAADAITHDLHAGYALSAIILGVLTLLAGWFTRPPGPNRGSPLVDGRYWLAMLLAGLFGTVAGDLTSQAIGLYAASAALTGLLLLILAGRAVAFPAAMLAYWVAVLAERSAATPVADAIDSRRGLALGLPVAMAITLTLFLLALLLRQWIAARPGHQVTP